MPPAVAAALLVVSRPILVRLPSEPAETILSTCLPKVNGGHHVQ